MRSAGVIAGSVPLGGGEKKFSGARKSTPFAAQRAAQYCANEAKKHGVVEIDVRVKGPGRRARVGDHRTASRRSADSVDRRCHAAAAQRLPASQASQGVIMSTILVPPQTLSRREGVNLHAQAHP
jgi:hypothetical protein